MNHAASLGYCPRRRSSTDHATVTSTATVRRHATYTQIAAWSPLPEPGARTASTPSTVRPNHPVNGCRATCCQMTAPSGSRPANTPAKAKVICANVRQNNPK